MKLLTEVGKMHLTNLKYGPNFHFSKEIVLLKIKQNYMVVSTGDRILI